MPSRHAGIWEHLKCEANSTTAVEFGELREVRNHGTPKPEKGVDFMLASLQARLGLAMNAPPRQKAG